jgi:plastocyanin
MLIALAVVTIFGPPDATRVVLSQLPASPAPPPQPGRCAFTGKVTLWRENQEVPAQDRVVVYVKRVPPSVWKPTRRATYQVEQRKRGLEYEFSEDMKVILEDEEIEFTNPNEEQEHNVFSQSEHTFEIAETPYRTTGTHRFVDVGTYHVQCDIHAGMRMDILVVRNPFFAKVGPDGAFKLPELPEGRYTLVAWERNGGQSIVEVSCPSSPTMVDIRLDEASTPPHRHKDKRPWTHSRTY